MSQRSTSIEDYRDRIKILKSKLRRLQTTPIPPPVKQEPINAETLLRLVTKIQSCWRMMKEKKFFNQFKESDKLINESYYLSLQKLSQKVKDILGLTLEETYRAIDENSTGEIELYEFFQFFRDVRIPMTKTQIKRQTYKQRCLYLFDEECEGKVKIKHFNQMLQAFYLSSESVPASETPYDQEVLGLLMSYLPQENLDTILPILMTDKNKLDLNHKLQNYLKSIQKPPLKERELFTIKNIFGEGPDAFSFVNLLEKIYRKQNNLNEALIQKIYQQIGKADTQKVSKHKKILDYQDVIQTMQKSGVSVSNVLIKLVTDSKPGQQYFQPLFVKQKLEFYFSSILNNNQILQLLNQLHYEKDGTLHFEELQDFILKHAKNENLLQVKLLVFVRNLEIEQKNCLNLFTFHHNIDKTKEYLLQEFINDYAKIINLDHNESAQFYALLCSKFKRKNVISLHVANYLDRLRTDNNRSEALWAKEQFIEQDTLLKQKKYEIHQAYLKKSKDILDFVQFLDENNIDIYKEFKNLQKNGHVKIQKLYALLIKLQPDTEAYRKKILYFLDMLDIFKSQTIDLRQIQIQFQTSPTQIISEPLRKVTEIELDEVQINLRKVLSIMNMTTLSFFNVLDMDKKGYVSFIEFKSFLSYYNIQLSEIMKIAYYFDPTCKNEVRLEDLNSLCLDKIEDISLDFTKQYYAYQDLRASFRNQVENSKEAVEKLRIFLFLDPSYQLNMKHLLEVFSEKKINRDQFLKLLDQNFTIFDENDKIALLDLADCDRQNEIDIHHLIQMIQEYHYDIKNMDDIEADQEIQNIKDNDRFGIIVTQTDLKTKKKVLKQKRSELGLEIQPSEISKTETQIEPELSVTSHPSHIKTVTQIYEPYVDTVFPDHPDSISKRKKGEKYKLIYARCKFLVPKEFLAKDYTYLHDPDPSDLETGPLGNCQLIPALALISQNQRLLKSIFQTEYQNPEGKYTLVLYKKGQKELVTVSATFPCFLGQNVFLKSSGDIWALLIEKALAKFYKSYDILFEINLTQLLLTLVNHPLIFSPEPVFPSKALYLAQSQTDVQGLIKDHFYCLIQKNTLLYTCGEVHYLPKSPLPEFLYEDKLNRDQASANKEGLFILQEPDIEHFKIYSLNPMNQVYHTKSITISKHGYYSIESEGLVSILLYHESDLFYIRLFDQLTSESKKSSARVSLDPNLEHKELQQQQVDSIMEEKTDKLDTQSEQPSSLSLLTSQKHLDNIVLGTPGFIELKKKHIEIGQSNIKSEAQLIINYTKDLKIQETSREDIDNDLVEYFLQQGIQNCERIEESNVFFSVFQDTPYTYVVFIENRGQLYVQADVKFVECENLRFPKYVRNQSFSFSLQPLAKEIRQFQIQDWKLPAKFKVEKKIEVLDFQ